MTIVPVPMKASDAYAILVLEVPTHMVMKNIANRLRQL